MPSKNSLASLTIALASALGLASGCGSTQHVTSGASTSPADLADEIDFLERRAAIIASDCNERLRAAGSQPTPTTVLEAETSRWVRVGSAPGCVSGIVERSVLDDPATSGPIPAVSDEGAADVVGYYVRGVGLLSPAEMKTPGIDVDRLADAVAVINRPGS